MTLGKSTKETSNCFVCGNVHGTEAQRFGALSGIGISWKDVFPLDGHITRAGTRFLAQASQTTHPLISAFAVEGATFIGMTQLTELAFSVLGENWASDMPINPWSAEARVCGGSSSGSAAGVSRGLCDASMGTDSGGSVRLPAAWCGVVGFKPTQNRLWSDSTVGFSQSVDTVGILARDIKLVRSIFDVMEGKCWSDGSVRLARPKLPSWLELDPDICPALDKALDAIQVAGYEIEPFDYDIFQIAAAHRERYGSLASLEGAARWRQIVLDAGDLASPRLRHWFEMNTDEVPTDVLVQMREERDRQISVFNAQMDPNIVLVLPATPISAPRLSDLTNPRDYVTLYALSHSLLWPFNDLDAPAITLPCGWTNDGLPVSIQLVAAQGQDALLLETAEQIANILTFERRLL